MLLWHERKWFVANSLLSGSDITFHPALYNSPSLILSTNPPHSVYTPVLFSGDFTMPALYYPVPQAVSHWDCRQIVQWPSNISAIGMNGGWNWISYISMDLEMSTVQLVVSDALLTCLALLFFVTMDIVILMHKTISYEMLCSFSFLQPDGSHSLHMGKNWFECDKLNTTRLDYTWTLQNPGVLEWVCAHDLWLDLQSSWSVTNLGTKVNTPYFT